MPAAAAAAAAATAAATVGRPQGGNQGGDQGVDRFYFCMRCLSEATLTPAANASAGARQ